MFGRIAIMIRKELLQFVRNTALLFLVLYAMNVDVYTMNSSAIRVANCPIAVYDMDKSRESREVISHLRKPLFDVKYDITDEGQIRQLMENGLVYMAIVFPRDFGRDISSAKGARLQAIVDGSNSTAAEISLNYLANILAKYNSRLLFSEWKVTDRELKLIPRLDPEVLYRYNPNLEDGWTLCLYELFCMLTLLGLLLSATTMVNEKQFGTIEQLMVTPLRSHEIMIAKVLSMILVLSIGSFICLFTILRALIGIPIMGSVWEFFMVTVIYIFSISGLGLFVSTISNNLPETMLFSLLVTVPIMFLSGTSVPVEALPSWMQWVVGFSPLTYYVRLGGGILLKGNSLSLMWVDLTKLICLGTAVFIWGAMRLKKLFK